MTDEKTKKKKTKDQIVANLIEVISAHCMLPEGEEEMEEFREDVKYTLIAEDLI